ncbi:MAG: bifunctional phosphoribosylaminoimidazolecarboxamide formyltransferase/IMP cyclohydrolase [Myxococcota bacterium]
MTRALISVSDKTGVVAFAQGLADRGIAIMSTGGTLRTLREAGIEAEAVETYTGSPEVMGGRVKTLHPRIHGGILARIPEDPDRGGQADDDDRADLERLGAAAIDLVVCNLYPFARTVAGGADLATAIENIDIGGPSMVRSAAKNHARVTVVCDPDDYGRVLEALERDGTVSATFRRTLAAKAFAHTAHYDGVIAAYLAGEAEVDAADPPLTDQMAAEVRRFPATRMVSLERVTGLRYGENPHQGAAWYRERGLAAGTLAAAQEVGAGGKALSFNNLVDLDAAYDAVREHERPAAAVIKHTNPCGLAVHDELVEAYRRARAGDPVSAFGGIVALNRPCDLATAEVIAETFIECVVAPAFDGEALARLRRKKKLRLVAVGSVPAPRGLTYKRLGGGFVVQDEDATGPGEVDAGRVVTRRAPTAEERAGLDFAWKVCKHVKSNAIVFARGTEVVGVGAGQMSRVQSVAIAGEKAGAKSRGAVMASDAFFPFPDGVEAAAALGITAVVQPGGSVKDDEVIAACDAVEVAMIFTGHRHFRH